MMMIIRVFYWVYLDISGALEETPNTALTSRTPATSALSTRTDVQTVSSCRALDSGDGMSPITISRLYQSTEFYGDHPVFKKRKNTELEPHFLGEMTAQGKLSFDLQLTDFVKSYVFKEHRFFSCE